MSEPSKDAANDRTVNPGWGVPTQTEVRFILHQNQVWVNRRSLLLFLDREIEIVRANHVPGINEYWDAGKIEYLQFIRKEIASLDPERGEVAT